MSIISIEDMWDGEYNLIEFTYKHPSTKEKVTLYLNWEEAQFIVERLTEIFTHT